MQKMQFQSPAQENPLEEGMATHSNIPAGIIKWAEEHGGLQSTEIQRARHSWAQAQAYPVGSHPDSASHLHITLVQEALL